MSIRPKFDVDALQALARQSRGVVRVATLRGIGMPSSAIAHRTRPLGPWHRLLPGVVLTTSGTVTWLQWVTAAMLYAGPEAVVSGMAALRLEGVRGLPNSEDRIQVVIPTRYRRVSTAGITIERTQRMPEHAVRARIRCAPVARAVIDAARAQDDLDAVRQIISAAVQQGRCSPPELFAELASGNQRGSRIPRFVLGEVIEGVRSVAEAKVRRVLQAAGVPEPLWNHDVFDASGRWLGRPDAIWIELGVVLEIDSLAFHLSPADYRRTRERQRRLTKAGLLVLPVTPSAVRDDPARLLAEVRETLAAARKRAVPTISVAPPVNGTV